MNSKYNFLNVSLFYDIQKFNESLKLFLKLRESFPQKVDRWKTRLFKNKNEFALKINIEKV